MDAAFDEDFTSPMVLPNLTFYGALRLRDTSVHAPLQEAEIETTSTSVDPRLSPKYIMYALKYAEKIHDIIPIRGITDNKGRPTAPYMKAFKRKPYVQHFKTFDCPAVFK